MRSLLRRSEAGRLARGFAKRRAERGASIQEVTILIAVASVCVILMMPFFFRHMQGYLFFDNARSFDRQFDPYDTSHDTSDSVSQRSSIRISGGGMPDAPLFAPTSDGGSVFYGISFFPKDLPRGPVPRASAGATTQLNMSSGSAGDTYDYQDNLQPTLR